MIPEKNPRCKYSSGCVLECRGCKPKKYDRRDYDGYNLGNSTEGST